MASKKILLIIGGGIAAFKSLDLIRRLRELGHQVIPVLTKSATEFVTPLSVSALAGEKVYHDLFDLNDESEMGHIELSRAVDLIVVAPVTADLMAKMAHGHANDLASTLLMATDKQVLIAPSMNVRMWEHAATQRNLSLLENDGILTCGPNEGSMACGEFGFGRMAEPLEIITAIETALNDGPLNGRHILVTSGPTHEPIDPVRYIANRSSGAQGTAIARALLALGARVSFVTGPADVPPPMGVDLIKIQTAVQMLDAVQALQNLDVGIFVAAVADWRIANASDQKIKKKGNGLPVLELSENPDILATVCASKVRPKLVVGFAAETQNVVENATAKRHRKGCDWIVANDVSSGTDIMGGAENDVVLITADGPEDWPRMGKDQVAQRLAKKISEALG